ncbi:MAG TPA: cytochrome b/b6 domain-containing protein [Mucilaginibacter sp.]|nr:cytochrome b/b6 domain-containing protein [Mucilaginibacter sp.]
MTQMRHRRWVKGAHFIVTLSFMVLLFSGYIILMSHPRLYWGQAGNDLTPALFELPVSRNFHHNGWTRPTPFLHTAGSQVTAGRTYDIFNQNGWGRSTHFLAAWFLVLTGIIYLLMGIFSGHFLRDLLPLKKELNFKLYWRDMTAHLKKMSGVLPEKYGLLQKTTYLVVIFFVLPVIVLTGFTMSPAITAAHPVLLDIFFGEASARTIHFFCFGDLAAVCYHTHRDGGPHRL